MLAATPGSLSFAEPARRRHVLACVDRSRFSLWCVKQAAGLARAFAARVSLLHVLERRPERRAPHAGDVPQWDVKTRESRAYVGWLQGKLERVLGEPVGTRVEQGCAAERIADLARELHADVTVLGRGSGGDGAALGRTSRHVLARARCSVFVGRGCPGAEARAGTRRILVPLDGSPRAEAALPAAARMANAHGAEIILAHVVRLPVGLLPADEDVALARRLAERMESGAERYLARARGGLAPVARLVRCVVSRHSSGGRGLLDAARDARADLIVLSAHGSTCDTARSFGGVTEYLLAHGTVPLLMLQDLGEGSHFWDTARGARGPAMRRRS